MNYPEPIVVNPYLNNAFFVRPGSVPITPTNDPVLTSMQSLSNSPIGGVMVGEKLFNPTIIAHEIGHGRDKSLTGAYASTFSNFWDKYYLPAIGTLGAIGVGRMFPEYQVPAAVANIGIQALSALPTLISESNANAIARKLEKNIDENQLNDMYNSYIKSMIHKRLAGPILGHGIDLLL